LVDRFAIAPRRGGAPLTTAEAGIATLLPDTALHEAATEALQRVSSEAESVETHEPAPANMGIGV
jgi:hypothetical protein